ncbi:unnamed protein product [Ostreobium quekettii]|uniref:Uncharacterized protein n=1 Tax=Ostreobium quekettii TaxID=121088 RepID=A0A8S1IYU9_9CHLO|nr:unnamed protein product [Ostreobium quekettii]|eukprot:evm.model.scf_580EXC.3 EVM.evm.TU.scf_580EXC.3   scf_580EXC:15191-17713(+)
MAPLACGGAFAPLRAGPARCAGLWCVARGVKPETCTTLREAAERQGGIPRVILKRGKARLFHLGSHLVFSGAIDRVEGVRMPTHGDTVLLYDGSKMLLGWGLFNPDSMYRVRIMQRCQDAEQQPQCALDLWQLLQTRIEEAVTLRRALGFPSEETNAYRLINSDGDHLSGLVVDVLGDLLVAAPGAAWLQINRQTVVNLLMECTGIRNVIWRPTAGSMEQEGLHDVDAEIFSEGRELASEQVEIREGSIPFLASPFGQKTGFYMDQRDSRAVIRRLAKGQEVLDVYCYSGGFAINAALGGARGVVGVDSSAPAIELAEKNATLSGVSDACSFTQADATQYLELAKQEGRLWDLVVLDPPKLAPNRQSLQRAIPHYRRINRAAIRVLRRGGLLMTCTCSGAMTQSNKFLDVVKQAADAEGRRVTVLRVAGASADHSVSASHPEANYLTNVLCRVL